MIDLRCSHCLPIHNRTDDDDEPSHGTRRSPSAAAAGGDGDTVVDVNRLTKAGFCFQKDKCVENWRLPKESCILRSDRADMQWQRSTKLGYRMGPVVRRHYYQYFAQPYKWTVLLLALLSLAGTANGFHAWAIKSCGILNGGGGSGSGCSNRCVHKKQPCFMSVDEEDCGKEGRTEDDMFGEDLDTGAVMIEELSWRVEKMRLEEQNKQRFLKARPRFLPYEECRKWVQAFGRWETEEDWRQWISMGEKRNSYIPSKPDEYYGRLGQWVSWEHFLNINPDDDDDDEQS
eukprot:scaffold2243_cov165-Amphora_coffeaeformis.AAC.10